jgi:glycosyltransferase involved in cell wall biosynthesis
MKDPYRIEPIPDGPRPAALDCGISVIIPVKNGGRGFAELLRRIRSQRKVGEVEILILDSESADDSVAVAESFGCRVVRIPQKEFNHGATRDIGARQAGGEYLVFTVQDALPVGNYWLYGMVRPFLSVPGLGGVSSRQFVRPEADMFSQWLNEATNEMIGFDGDCVYGADGPFDPSRWDGLPAATKRRLCFFDNVSSCIPKRVYDEVPFRPVVNAEDIDLGIRMIGKGWKLGFLASTGVYHWHDRGADYVLKRHYIGTKANHYILKNPLPRFFERQEVGWRTFVANVAGLLDLAALAAPDPEDVDPDPVKAAARFLSSFRRNFEAAPAEVEAALGRIADSTAGRLESLCPGLFAGAEPLPAERLRFRSNFLAPYFLEGIGRFTGFFAARGLSYAGRGGEFTECVRKVLASVVGEAAGAFFLEAETRGRLNAELERMDRLLAKGVCTY